MGRALLALSEQKKQQIQDLIHLRRRDIVIGLDIDIVHLMTTILGTHKGEMKS